MQSRIQSDSKDRRSVKIKIELCNMTYSKNDATQFLLSILKQRKVIGYSAIINNIFAIGKASIQEFKVNWSEGLNKSLSSKVKTVVSSQEHIKVSNTTVYDTEVTYAQAIALKQTKNLDADTLMAHKLATLPPSTFKEAGEIKEAKTKSILKKSVKIEFSEQSSTRR